MERWGIIYSPKSGQRSNNKRWDAIRRLLDARHAPYDYVQSEGSGSEARLASMLAQNGYRTIIVVGGDVALNHALNGLASAQGVSLADLRLGVVPNGHANDFASYWGLTEGDPQLSVQTLAKGRVRKVDLGAMHLPSGETVRFLNCINIGLVANIADIKHKAYRFWGLSGLSHASSALLLVFQRMETPMTLALNHHTISRKLMNVCIGNARGYGLTPGAVPYNGLLDVSVLFCPPLLQLLTGLSLLRARRFHAFRGMHPYRTMGRIRVADTGGAKVSVDGVVLASPPASFEVSVQREALSFIIP